MNKPFDHDGPVPILYRCIEIEHLRLLSPNGYAERIMRENFVRIAARIAALLLVTHFSTAETPPTYTTAEASSHIGEIAIVCGKVFVIHHSGPGYSFINLDG